MSGNGEPRFRTLIGEATRRAIDAIRDQLGIVSPSRFYAQAWRPAWTTTVGIAPRHVTISGWGGRYDLDGQFDPFPSTLPKRGPYLCRQHADCLAHPDIAHGCWVDQRERRGDPQRRLARHEAEKRCFG